MSLGAAGVLVSESEGGEEGGEKQESFLITRFLSLAEH